jgi:3,4-dehydroadipyl-CoA semialdehyde dehydrogenase
VHINAFNFPAWGLAEKAAVALLAGMPVISKPATSTALLTVRVVEAHASAADALEPRPCCQLVAGSRGRPAVSHLGGQDVHGVHRLVRAPARTLRGLRQRASRATTRVNVEADSLNATVLTAPTSSDGSDLWACFVRHAVTEMTQKAGQKCTATRRIFVRGG